MIEKSLVYKEVPKVFLTKSDIYHILNKIKIY